MTVCLIGGNLIPSHQPKAAARSQSSGPQHQSTPHSYPKGQMPTPDTLPQFIDTVRSNALAHTESLPDFICMQKTRRLANFGELADWRFVDQIVAEISYRQGKEHSRILTIDNKPPSPRQSLEIPGFSSEGDFGNALYLLFAPESNASFTMEGSERIRKRKTLRIRYYVPLPTSRFHIGLGGQIVTTPYSGRCWIDLESHQVVRLDSEAEDIPRSIPVTSSSHSTEYDLVDIAGTKYWLPVHSSVEMHLANGPQEMDLYKALYGRIDPTGASNTARKVDARNDIEYKQYRKFGAETRLVPTDE